MFNIISIQPTLAAETILWRDTILSNGGDFEYNSIFIANNFIRNLKTKSYFHKIVYLLPFLGKKIPAACVPLVDVLAAGIASNSGFVDADFSQNLGLQGNGTSKLLNLLLNPTQLNSNATSGGLGYWENNISFAGTDSVPFGCYFTGNTDIRSQIDLRTGSSRFAWRDRTNVALNNSAPGNGHFYGQSNANNSRILYFNGAVTATNTTTDTNVVSSTPMTLLGTNAGLSGNWAGRCAVAYMTDGTLTSDEISDFDLFLRAFLVGTTGKI